MTVGRADIAIIQIGARRRIRCPKIYRKHRLRLLKLANIQLGYRQTPVMQVGWRELIFTVIGLEQILRILLAEEQHAVVAVGGPPELHILIGMQHIRARL
ncbi:hypothetical protein D3C78_878950 [compost metagenome]